MSEKFSRTEKLIGTAGMEILARSRVAVFGIGGVGGHVAESLVRSGIGKIDLIDNDIVCESNINRQIFATEKTVDMQKTEAAFNRLHDINSDCIIKRHDIFFMPDTAGLLDFSEFDYVVDAIDTVTGKIEIIIQAQKSGVPVISSMGAGNKLDPTAFEVADVYKTSVCPLARVMRRELKKRDVKKLKVVYSKEQPVTTSTDFPASCAFVPSVAGLIIAGEVIKDLIKDSH
ncbi:MAG: tRNA threonylcarbamoyladenosine dehydratase [Muribaculaceae bacterium]|nr:tRNA threonylcarbamoyladenosine dehydratase [Alistipes senegalensis]MCM1474378.1 tRNA threonylcarbamoyladenosine dehydratase [Muribaculaceae bacterium]